MSMFKKVLSVVLCICMLAGSFAMLGDLVPQASAATGTSMVKSYDALEEQYDKFIYLGEEAYEEDADGNLVLTDYYVQPGDWITYRLYVKSDLFIGNSMPYTAYDNSFFDVTICTDEPVLSNGYETLNDNAPKNPNHPMVADQQLFHSLTSKTANGVTTIKNGYCELDVDSATLDITMNQWTKDTTNSALAFMNIFTSDEWLLEWKVQVKEGLDDGTKGISQIYYNMYKIAKRSDTGATDSRRPADVSSAPCDTDVPQWADVPKYSQAKSMYVNKDLIQHFFVEDTYMEFTIGENPADNAGGEGGGSDVPSGPIVGTSMVKSYDAIEAEYDKFIYLGEEAYEDDGDGNLILTDYYVQPGDWITYRLYVKSDLFIGNSMPYTAYDNSFFDVTICTDEPVLSNGYETLNDNAPKNPNHPMVADQQLFHSLTSKTANGVTTIKNGYCELDVDSATLDITMNQWTKDTTNSALAFMNIFTSDEWLLEWKVQVKEGLDDGTKGISQIYYNMYKIAKRSDTGATDSRRPADVSSAPCDTDVPQWADVPKYSQAKSMYVNKDLISHFFVEDTYMTFTIGENPAASGGGDTPAVTKYTATFVDAEGNELAKESYEAGAAVVAPAAVEGEIGWANTRDGKLVDFSTFTMPKRNLTFQRVLDTDEFDVTVNLDGGVIPEDAELPENVVVNDDGSLTAKVGFGETLDMSTIPAPEKAGYDAAWDPAEITIDNIGGAKAKAVYTAKTYKATFYINKGDAEPFKVIDIAYNGNLICAGATSEGKKFAGWMDASTDTLASSTAALGKYTFTEDKSYYAAWTEYDYSITLMVRDYVNGGWKVGVTKYADNGTWKNSDAKNAITGSAIGWDGAVKVMGISTSADVLDATTVVNSDLAYNGDSVYYVYTALVAEVSWMIPKTDAETGIVIEGEYDVTTETKQFGYATEEKAGSLNVTFSNVEVPVGYTHSGWTKNGEEVNYNYNGITITYADGAKVELKAVVEETDFKIIFNLQNGDFVQKIELEGEQKLGDFINIDGDLTLKDAAGPNDYPFASADKVLLPEAGLENSEQANGGYFNKNGYEFVKWTVGVGANKIDADFTNGFEITPEIAQKYGSSGTITFDAVWEACEYDLKFYYTMADGSKSEPYVITLKTGDLITLPTAANNPDLFALINANAPEGTRFQVWKFEGDRDTGRMPAYGGTYNATYTGRTIAIYIDYNHGKTVDSEGNAIPVENIIKPYAGGGATYGDDVERVQDFEAGISQGIGRTLMNSLIDTADRPGDTYEIARWNRYHVKSVDDIYNKDKWISGINDSNTTIAQDTIIYQVEWVAHGDLFWRVYDTDGYVCKAMGKDFNLYYWSKGNVTDRENGVINRSDGGLVVLMLLPTLEGWNWDGFFDINMWSNLTFRIDPLVAPASMFTIESMIALFGALGNAIKELIAGI